MVLVPFYGNAVSGNQRFDRPALQNKLLRTLASSGRSAFQHILGLPAVLRHLADDDTAIIIESRRELVVGQFALLQDLALKVPVGLVAIVVQAEIGRDLGRPVETAKLGRQVGLAAAECAETALEANMTRPPDLAR